MAKKPDTDALCRELLALCRKNAEDDARRDEIKAELKKGAVENFQVTVAGLGKVKVSAPQPKRCTGTAPEVVVESFLALPQREQDRLTERGIVRIAQQWKNAYYGSVTPELF